MNRMTGKQKSIFKKGIILIFAFFLSFFLFFFSALLIFGNTLENPDYMRNQLGKSHYYEHAIEEVEEQFSSYASASGFDQQFFKTVMDINDVQLDVNQSLSVLYGESSEPTDKSQFENRLYGKLIENVKERGIPLSADTQKSLQLLAKTCTQTYVQYISIPYAAELSPLVTKMKKPILILELVLLFFIVLFAVAIYKMNRWRHRALRAYLYSGFGTVLMLAVLPALILLSGIVGRLAFISKSLYQFAVCYINGILYNFFFAALFFLLLSILFSFFYRYVKTKALYKDE